MRIAQTIREINNDSRIVDVGDRRAAQPAQPEQQQVACAGDADCLHCRDIERRKLNALDEANVIAAPAVDDLPAMSRLYVGAISDSFRLRPDHTQILLLIKPERLTLTNRPQA